MSGGFPSVVNVQPAVAVAGDFSSINPRATVVAGVGAFIAAFGVIVGHFAWADPTFTFLSSSGSGPVTGFIGREGLRADIVTPGPGFPYASNVILGGSYITAYSTGDFWAKNDGATTSVVGNKAYALFANGSVSFSATGTPPTSAALSSGSVAANVLNVSSIAVNSFVGSIAGNVLTVASVNSGGMFPGQVLSGGTTANPVDPGTVIIAQLTGATLGGAGTYSVSISQTVVSGTITGSGGWLTVTSLTSGKIWPGQILSGGSNAVVAGTTVLAGGAGTGGAGTYPVSISQTCASTATATATGGFFTATTLTSGALRAGDLLTSASGSATILPFGTGGTTGIGVGGGTTYALSNATEAGDTSGFGVDSGVETKWYAMSVGAPGELVIMSAVPLG